MYERIRQLYLDGQLSDAGLERAVAKGWLTDEQAQGIRTEREG